MSTEPHEPAHLGWLWLWILTLPLLREVSRIPAEVCRLESCVTGLPFANSCYSNNCFFFLLLSSWVDSCFLREYLVLGNEGDLVFFYVDCFSVSL